MEIGYLNLINNEISNRLSYLLCIKENKSVISIKLSKMSLTREHESQSETEKEITWESQIHYIIGNQVSSIII